jgi:hypothetical protein
MSSNSKLHKYPARNQPERLSSRKLNFTKPSWVVVQFSEARETQLHVYKNLELDLFTFIMPLPKKTVQSLSSSSLVPNPLLLIRPEMGCFQPAQGGNGRASSPPSWAASSTWRWEKLRGSRTLSSRHWSEKPWEKLNLGSFGEAGQFQNTPLLGALKAINC